MQGVPSPDDLAQWAMQWLGVPGVFILGFSSALALVGWLQFSKATVRHGRAAAETLRSATMYWTGARQRSFVLLILAGAGFVALTYTFAQLLGFTLHEVLDPNSPTRVEGRADWQYISQQILLYSRWDSGSGWAVTASAGSIALLNAADLANALGLRAFIVRTWTVVLTVACFAAILLAFTAACLLIGIVIDPKAPGWLLTLEVIAIICLALTPKLGQTISAASKQMYVDT